MDRVMELIKIWEFQKKDSIFKQQRDDLNTKQINDWKNGGSISTPLEFGVLMSFTSRCNGKLDCMDEGDEQVLLNKKFTASKTSQMSKGDGGLDFVPTFLEVVTMSALSAFSCNVLYLLELFCIVLVYIW